MAVDLLGAGPCKERKASVGQSARPSAADASMTTEFQNELFWADEDTFGRRMVNAVEQRKDTVYIPLVVSRTPGVRETGD